MYQLVATTSRVISLYQLFKRILLWHIQLLTKVGGYSADVAPVIVLPARQAEVPFRPFLPIIISLEHMFLPSKEYRNSQWRIDSQQNNHSLMGSCKVFFADKILRTLTALERGSQWKLACDLLKSSVAACDAVSYSACATACAKASAWQLGLQYLLTASEKKLRQWKKWRCCQLQEDEEWCSGYSRMWNIFCEYKGQFIQRIILRILLSQLCFSCFRPGPSSFSYVARQMGHHGAWQEALQLLSLLQDYDQGVKFEVWCSVMWAMDVSSFALHFFSNRKTPSQMVPLSTFLTMGGRLIATPPKTI